MAQAGHVSEPLTLAEITITSHVAVHVYRQDAGDVRIAQVDRRAGARGVQIHVVERGRRVVAHRERDCGARSPGNDSVRRHAHRVFFASIDRFRES